MNRETLAQLRNHYHSFLKDNFLPYWKKHGLDTEYGGFLNCIRNNGELLSENKYLWSQGRGLWTFSYLYEHFIHEEWLRRFIRKTANFLLEHGRDANDDWVYILDRRGNTNDNTESVFSDIFMAYGLTASGKALKDDHIIEEARLTCMRIREKIRKDDFCATLPYPVKPGEKLQGVTFIFLNVLTGLLELVDDAVLEDEARRCVRMIIDHHMDRNRMLNIEIVGSDNRELTTPEGRDFQPGHGTECAWMLMVEALRIDDSELRDTALTMLKWHITKGWDEDYGGFFWFLNIDGKTPYKKNWDNKPWWSPTEALLGLMLAYEETGDNWYRDWFDRVHEYAFRTFSDRENGEWYQMCDRQGEPVERIVALPVKDPFHLPRAVMFIIQSIDRQLGR